MKSKTFFDRCRPTLVVDSADGQQSKLEVDLKLSESSQFQRMHDFVFSAKLQKAETDNSAIEITVRNPKRAKHAGGYWDLGDPGSILFQGISLEFDLQKLLGSGVDQIEWIEGEGCKPNVATKTLEIYQESSGGENWNSINHVNRNNDVPMTIRGYVVTADGKRHSGLRAEPVVVVNAKEEFVAVSLEYFWQNFSSSIHVENGTLRLGLWPSGFPDLHELQAGEQKTFVVRFQFGTGEHPPWQELLSLASPDEPDFESRSFQGSDLIPFLPEMPAEVRPETQEFVTAAIDGPQSFFAKREPIDQYGWRNFGDAWGDHEEAYCEETSPVVSHYNNQYDLLYSFLIQRLLTGDSRYWELADSLAKHVIDIDIYHTTRDKPGYNGGQFWHTAHYHAAGTSTHRSMSRMMQDKKHPAPGGGPGNENNYATGLLLYYQLTGNEHARDAVISLADWTIAMDDGSNHVLSALCDSPTGMASCTRETEYHGPGRGAGNSINTLLDGWLLTGQKKYLDKSEEIIRRTIHPADDVDSRRLLDAESRWSYTVHLQSLYRFWCLTKDAPVSDDIRSYTAESLLHYAMWMAENEKVYFANPDQLEFPTETWAAQDIRKGNVILMASLLAPSDCRKRLIDCGREILDLAWKQLSQFESRFVTRSLALVLQQCYIEQYLEQQIACENFTPLAHTDDHGRPAKFQSQKAQIKEKIRSIPGIISLTSRAIRPSSWRPAIQQSWWANMLRR